MGIFTEIYTFSGTENYMHVARELGTLRNGEAFGDENAVTVIEFEQQMGDTHNND